MDWKDFLRNGGGGGLRYVMLMLDLLECGGCEPCLVRGAYEARTRNGFKTPRTFYMEYGGRVLCSMNYYHKSSLKRKCSQGFYFYLLFFKLLLFIVSKGQFKPCNQNATLCNVKVPTCKKVIYNFVSQVALVRSLRCNSLVSRSSKVVLLVRNYLPSVN